MENLKNLSLSLKGLSIYRSVLSYQPIKNILKIIDETVLTTGEYISTYAELLSLLYKSDSKGNFSNYLNTVLLENENFFALACAKGEFKTLPNNIKDAAYYDLTVLLKLLKLSCETLKEHIKTKCPENASLIQSLPSYFSDEIEIKPIEFFEKLINDYKTKGYSCYSHGFAFYLDTNEPKPQIKKIANPDNISLKQLKGYEIQKQKVISNTLALINGHKANNVLLYGDRGTGKSSTVKAVVNEFACKGLRLIEVSKENLKYLGIVIDALADIPMKFIIFIDDLSFSSGDDSYTMLKAVLEGSSNKLPRNMALYATTNRRHLITETFSAREGDEIHLKDTIDEVASLSDRFGITITYITPAKAEFLEIVSHLAKDAGIKIDENKLFDEANKWSISHGGFSPRIARQYIDYLAGAN